MSNSVGFCLKKVLSVKELIPLFDKMTGYEVSELYSSAITPGVLQYDIEDSNYPLWLFLYLSKEKPLRVSGLEMARILAAKFEINVITDVPSNHHLSRDEYKKCLCKPDGDVKIVVLDLGVESDDVEIVKNSEIELESSWLEMLPAELL